MARLDFGLLFSSLWFYMPYVGLFGRIKSRRALKLSEAFSGSLC
uniref:Uncharacterized protein n=1 Tax=Nelumbo nucifera TaxID=4432 RepID=A0A822YAX0_NELNU|nr:TPA_asm: hypothetical protein HUJ06_031188 [Nelumbo nucifera]